MAMLSFKLVSALRWGNSNLVPSRVILRTPPKSMLVRAVSGTSSLSPASVQLLDRAPRTVVHLVSLVHFRPTLLRWRMSAILLATTEGIIVCSVVAGFDLSTSATPSRAQ
eukprot:1186700-Prorocentrum_minimum.AAC.1